MRARLTLPAARLEIRRAEVARDLEFIARLGKEIFAWLGDYSTALPTWLRHSAVHSYIGEVDARSVGFTMVAYYPRADEKYAADLLCIGVAPEAQRHGHGVALLRHAIAEARAMRIIFPVAEMRLSVAAENTRARQLFAAFGFGEVAGDHGRYDSGQRALHLTRPIP